MCVDVNFMLGQAFDTIFRFVLVWKMKLASCVCVWWNKSQCVGIGRKASVCVLEECIIKRRKMIGIPIFGWWTEAKKTRFWKTRCEKQKRSRREKRSYNHFLVVLSESMTEYWKERKKANKAKKKYYETHIYERGLRVFCMFSTFTKAINEKALFSCGSVSNCCSAFLSSSVHEELSINRKKFVLLWYRTSTAMSQH